MAGALAAPTVGAAGTWTRVEAEHFVVYGEGSAKPIELFARKLATFDAVLRIFSPPSLEKGPPPQKLEIYLVRGQSELRRIAPQIGSNIVGFYSTSPNATYAVARVDAGLGAQTTIFHEYAHHFMLENFPVAYPGWYVEGWAEYFMTMDIGMKRIEVGRYNQNRVNWLLLEDWIPYEDVLTKRPGQLKGADKVALYYAQAWFLTHYMQATPERAKQLSRAIAAIAAGAEPRKAMEDATGKNIAALTRALKDYRKLPYIAFDDVFTAKLPPMKTSSLPESTDAFVLDSLRLARPGGKDPAYVADLRKRTQRFAGDALAEVTLARAEMALGDFSVGEAILKRRLAADPNELDSLRAAALGHTAAAMRDAPHRKEHLQSARTYAVRGYKIDQEDYRILFAYSYGRTDQPNYPNENDLNALLVARTLAPSVDEISLLTGQVLMKRGEKQAAKAVLSKVANNPHGGGQARFARRIIETGAQTLGDIPEEDDEDDAPPPPVPPAPTAPPAKAVPPPKTEGRPDAR